MKSIKKIVAGVAALAAAVGLVGCAAGGGGGERDSSLEQILDSGQIRYGVIVGEEPGFIQNTDGTWTGYLADTAIAIAEALDLEPVPVETTWANLALDLKTDKIDLAVGVQPTGARSLVADYTSHPIYTNYFSLIVTSDQFDDASWGDLNDSGIRIGAQVGDSTLQPIDRFAPEATVAEFDSRDKNLLALQSGQVDASANTLLNSLMAAASRSDLGAHVIIPEPLVAAPSAVMVRRSDDKGFLNAVDAVVWNLNSSGTVRAFILEHLESYGITEADLPTNATL